MGRFLLVILWVYGIILASGFWSTLFAVLLPIWSWYLAVEHLVTKFGLL